MVLGRPTRTARPRSTVGSAAVGAPGFQVIAGKPHRIQRDDAVEQHTLPKVLLVRGNPDRSGAPGGPEATSIPLAAWSIETSTGDRTGRFLNDFDSTTEK
jgi:hypothetical protein